MQRQRQIVNLVLACFFCDESEPERRRGIGAGAGICDREGRSNRFGSPRRTSRATIPRSGARTSTARGFTGWPIATAHSEFGWEIADCAYTLRAYGIAALRPMQWQNHLDFLVASRSSMITADGLRNARRLL